MECKIELKPCPFCGHMPALEDWTRGYDRAELPHWTWSVACEYDGCPCNPSTGDAYMTANEAITAWNRRATNGK